MKSVDETLYVLFGVLIDSHRVLRALICRVQTARIESVDNRAAAGSDIQDFRFNLSGLFYPAKYESGVAK